MGCGCLLFWDSILLPMKCQQVLNANFSFWTFKPSIPTVSIVVVGVVQTGFFLQMNSVCVELLLYEPELLGHIILSHHDTQQGRYFNTRGSRGLRELASEIIHKRICKPSLCDFSFFSFHWNTLSSPFWYGDIQDWGFRGQICKGKVLAGVWYF